MKFDYLKLVFMAKKLRRWWHNQTRSTIYIQHFWSRIWGVVIVNSLTLWNMKHLKLKMVMG